MSRRVQTRSGFTLVELMVAVTLGAVVIASVYTLGAASTRHFQEQQRVSQLQLATRIGLERVRRDASLAGFGGSPDSDGEASCGSVGGTPRVFGVTITDRDSDGEAALASMTGAADSPVHADRLRLAGNFDTGDMYLVRDYVGATINLQMEWQGFRRSFAADTTGTTVDEDLFEAVFAPGRIVRIIHPTGGSFFAVLGGASVSATNASVTITSPLPACADVCTGCIISPISGVEYFLSPAPAELAPLNPAVTGPNTVLMRGLWNPADGTSIAGTARPVLEWAIHFDVDALVNTAPPGAAPTLALADDTTIDGGGANRPAGIYSLDITVGARTPEQDSRFAWVAPTAGDPLTRFHHDPMLPGASRVRTARAEVLLPNIAYRGM